MPDKAGGEVVLTAVVAAFRRSLIPVHRGNWVGRAAPAFFQASADQVHRLGMTLAGGAEIPTERLASVALHTPAAQQQIGEVVLRPIVELFGGPPVPRCCTRQIRPGTPALLETSSQHVHRGWVSGRGGNTEPLQSACRITRNTMTIQECLAEQHLCFHKAVSSRCIQPRRGLRC